MWQCKTCGEKRLSALSNRNMCYKCHYQKYKDNEYQKEYMRMKRWLDGGPDNFLISEKGYYPEAITWK